eukprot:8776795-Pyramimonas_sp.AAC.1
MPDARKLVKFREEEGARIIHDLSFGSQGGGGGPTWAAAHNSVGMAGTVFDVGTEPRQPIL